jgi:hypothetical protein
VLALAVALVVTASGGCGGDEQGTALRELGGFTAVSGVIRKSDKPFTYGAVAVSNTGSEPVVLKSVELVGARGGMRLLGSYVNTTTKSVAIWPTFPGPGARVKPLDGIRVPQKPPGVELILKLVRHGPASTALPGKGKAAWFTGLTITYDQGGETKTQTFDRKLTAWTKPRLGANVNK